MEKERSLVKRIGVHMEKFSNFLWGLPAGSEVETYGFSPKRAKDIKDLAKIIGVNPRREEPKGAVLDTALYVFERIISLQAEGYSIYAITPDHEQILQKYGEGEVHKFDSFIAPGETQEAKEHFGLSNQDSKHD